LLMFRNGFRRFLNSASESGSRDAASEMSLMVP
jgi:hypothetical protein